MRRATAVWGSSLFFAVAPGVVAGVVPWALTRWSVGYGSGRWVPVQLVGLLVLTGCTVVLAQAFARFVREGVGTPAPLAPTETLVVGGLYRHVRNPMYVAVVGAILGQALLLWQAVLVAYAAVVALAFVLFVLGYEQPSLQRQFGAQYEAYRRAVPAWWPRLRPWRPEREQEHFSPR